MNKKQEKDIEKEIQEAVDEKREVVEEAEKEVKEKDKIEEVTKQPYSKAETGQNAKYRSAKANDVVSDEEFYLKKKEDIKKVKNAINEYRKSEPSRANVKDSEFYAFESETLKIKLRKMPRTVLDILKHKKILIDYVKDIK